MLGDIFGVFWGVFGVRSLWGARCTYRTGCSIWGHFGAVLRPFWGRFGYIEFLGGYFKASWGIFGVFWATFGV